ncbi:MAG: PilZ domain-containing protein [Pseudomonadota bacterium]
MSDALSVTTFVVDDRLPWPDDAPGLPEQGPFDPAVIHDSGGRQPCSIRKISPRGATLYAEMVRGPGESVSIELGNGKRSNGTVAWSRRGELGVSFKEPIDMVALLNRTLVSQPAERRTMPRVEVRCPLHVKCGAAMVRGALRNISAKGLQIEGEELPERESYVTVFIEGLNVPAGEIVWKRGNIAGIELFEEMSWTSVIPWVKNVVRKG